jgi:hypothetical protein
MRNAIWVFLILAATTGSVSYAKNESCRSFSLRLAIDDRNPSSPLGSEKLKLHPLSREKEQLWTKKESVIDSKSIEKAYITPSKPLFSRWQILLHKLNPWAKPIPPDLEKQFTKSGEPIINLKITPTGVAKLAAVTKNNVGKKMAIVIDEQLLLAALIVEPLNDPVFQLTSTYNNKEASAIVDRINSLRGCQ